MKGYKISLYDNWRECFWYIESWISWYRWSINFRYSPFSMNGWLYQSISLTYDVRMHLYRLDKVQSTCHRSLWSDHSHQVRGHFICLMWLQSRSSVNVRMSFMSRKIFCIRKSCWSRLLTKKCWDLYTKTARLAALYNREIRRSTQLTVLPQPIIVLDLI